MISWAVVGHEQRLLAATTLAHQLGGLVTIDDGTHGADGNHLKAWDITAATEDVMDWSGVMEDDAVPVPGFAEQAEQALAQSPEPVVSFYLGRTRPHRWQQERIAPAIAKADMTASHWLVSTHVLHAVAVAMRTELREDWLDFAHGSKLPIDERLTAWCLARGHRVAYSLPSLVDHADGPTLVQHRNGGGTTAPRVAWRTGTRDQWTPASTRM